MNSEIKTKLDQKEVALGKAQFKIDSLKRSIESKQLALTQLEDEMVRKTADMGRMKELAKVGIAEELRLIEVEQRMQEIQKEHVFDPSVEGSVKLLDNPEYKALKAEREDLHPKVKQTKEQIMAIFYGKA